MFHDGNHSPIEQFDGVGDTRCRLAGPLYRSPGRTAYEFARNSTDNPARALSADNRPNSRTQNNSGDRTRTRVLSQLISRQGRDDVASFDCGGRLFYAAAHAHRHD